MYQAAEGKVHPERKKVKTAVHTIFELLHRVEASAERGCPKIGQCLKMGHASKEASKLFIYNKLE